MEPNITWPVFEACNENQTSSFEEMCRRLFMEEFAAKNQNYHVDPNTPGVEVLPVFESQSDGERPHRRISFQCKFISGSSNIYSQFEKSAEKTAEHYRGKLDAVYLFCNKPLNTASTRYRRIESIHNSAGIETIPVSNGELLDLVFKHRDVCNYYFIQRSSGIGFEPCMSCQLMSVPVETSLSQDINKLAELVKLPEYSQLTKELMAEKLESLYNYALSINITALEAEVDKLSSYCINDTEGESAITYYMFLVLLHNGRDFSETLSKCAGEYKAEANWLAAFYIRPSGITQEEFLKRTPITQVFIVEKLFSLMQWDDIIALYNSVKENVDSSVAKQLELFLGLSLLNKQENDKASEILNSLYAKTNEIGTKFFALCADIRKENAVYQNGMNGHHDVLAELVQQLDSFKELSQYKQNECFVTATRIETAFHLGMKDKYYLEDTLEQFKTYSAEIQSNSGIRYYYALCLELNGCREDAIKVYEQLDWKENTEIANRYMLCLIMNERLDDAVGVYEGVENRDIQTEALYLLALACRGDESYEEKLQECIEANEDCLLNLSQITHFAHDDRTTNTLLSNALRKHITPKALCELPFYAKVELLSFLAHNGEICLVETVLRSIADLSAINSFAVWEVYNASFLVAKREYTSEPKALNMPEDFDACERIADEFIKASVSSRLYLQVKILCVGAKQKPISFLHYSKQLFDITGDEESARNIVMSLFSKNATDPDEYNPYLEVLENSEVPESSIAVAYAKLATGRIDDSEYYAYRALYCLNETEDLDVYKRFLTFCHQYFHHSGYSEPSRSVKANSVVRLERISLAENNGIIEICLDSETEFSDHANHSMGIEHCSRADKEYTKLISAGRGQVIKIREGEYKITRIVSRLQFGYSYILKKVNENPSEFNSIAQVIKTNNPEELIKQLRELGDDSESAELLLKMYHCEDNPLGLPIDSLISKDPNRYLDAVKFLLFSKNEAFYAGEYSTENEIEEKYVLSLSTLALLAVLKRVDVLGAFKPNIIIPESYVAFLRDQYAKSKELDRLHAETLIFDKGKPVLVERDESLSDIWESILDFCDSCETACVSDNERMDFNIVEGYSGERFITGLRLNTIHLDALILAHREEAPLWCDDLFFRKVCNSAGIRHVNTASMVVSFIDLDKCIEIIKELSKTNYIYTPIRARTDDEFDEIVSNMLDGEKKNKYHGIMLKLLCDRLGWMTDRSK